MPKREIKTNFDKDCLDLIDGNVNLIVPWYLMSAYAYYEEDNPILSDHIFDRLAKKMLKEYENIEHIHKDHITKDDLTAGTFLGEYPSRIKGALSALRGKNG